MSEDSTKAPQASPPEGDRPDAELETRHPLDLSIREQLARPVYRAHRSLWDKANDRLLDDPEGAITAARSLLESTCKLIVGELKVPHSASSDLPKLYDAACRALGMAPGGQLDPSFRAVFSSTYTVVQSVAEIRNRYGDAHGRANPSSPPSGAEAELAVHLAGAVSCFLVRRFESHLNATRRVTRDGKAILWLTNRSFGASLTTQRTHRNRESGTARTSVAVYYWLVMLESI